jgi:hypothetical protein
VCKMDLSLPSTRWENVRKRILVAIEEEQKRKATISIQSADNSVFVISGSKPQIGNTQVKVTASTADTNFANKGVL